MLMRCLLFCLFFLVSFGSHAQHSDSIERPDYNVLWPVPEVVKEHRVQEIIIWKYTLSDSGTVVDSALYSRNYYNQNGVWLMSFDYGKTAIWLCAYSFEDGKEPKVNYYKSYESGHRNTYLLQLPSKNTDPEIKLVTDNMVVSDSSLLFVRQERRSRGGNFSSIFGDYSSCEPKKEIRPLKPVFGKNGKVSKMKHGRDHYFVYTYNAKEQVLKYEEFDTRKICWTETPKGRLKVDAIRNRKRFEKYKKWEKLAKTEDSYKKKWERACRHMERLRNRITIRKGRQNVHHETLATYGNNGELLTVANDGKLREKYFYNQGGKLIRTEKGNLIETFEYHANGLLYKYTRKIATRHPMGYSVKTRFYKLYE
jgi:hypothetical protein